MTRESRGVSDVGWLEFHPTPLVPANDCLRVVHLDVAALDVAGPGVEW